MHTFGKITVSVFAVVGVLLVLGLMLPTQAYSQQAVIEGTVTSAATGNPLPGANVIIRGTNVGTATGVDGRFRMTVPVAQVTGESTALIASFVGYRAGTQTITLTSGSHTVNFQLVDDVFGMEDIVVTGVVGATFKERLPFTVDIVSRSALEEVPYVSADQAIRGKVAGAYVTRGSGQPGEAASIRLRGSGSITGSSEPLIIVDGVILGSSMVDIDALDLESVEVVKGAAASSLYGARAANGVIHYRTRRGASLAMDQTSITVRNEVGMNQMPTDKQLRARYHMYQLSADGSTYLGPDGNPVTDVTQAAIDGWDGTAFTAFNQNAYPGETYDHLDLFFNPGWFTMNSITLAHRSGNTNFLASISNAYEPGVIRWDETATDLEGNSVNLSDGIRGYDRQNLRLNLDHRLAENLNLSVSTMWAQSERQNVTTGIGSVFFGLLFQFPNANLLSFNEDNTPYNVRAAGVNTYEPNPLYEIANRDGRNKRQRLLGSFMLNYQALDWLAFEGNFSFDRSDLNNEEFYDKGFKTEVPYETLNNGYYWRSNQVIQALNGSIDASVTQNFGLLATNTRLRYLGELVDSDYASTAAQDFVVSGVKSWANANPARSSVTTTLQKIRSEGYMFMTSLDYDGRYIGDFLVRRDGSSLFGPDERWSTYYRFSFAYRMAQEEWWPVEQLDEFKLRYSLGTAGGRPLFAAQYETWAFQAGNVVKRTLGNRDLKPEFATEQEIGLEIGLLDRVRLELVHAKTVTEDQLLLTPLPGLFGYSHRWENAGTLESTSIEASLRAYLLQSRDMSWSMNLLFDKTESKITKFDVTPYRWGPQQQNADVFYNREGEEFGTFYGIRWMTGANELPEAWAAYADYFQVEGVYGYLVPVGQNNSWTDGVSNQLWGTSVVLPDGTSLPWGMPVRYIDEDGNDFHRIGKAMPDFSMALGTNFRFKGFSAYLLFEGQFGGDIYNMTKHWSMRDLPIPHRDADMAGVPDGEKKPVQFFRQLYATADPSSHFVEDGGYVKLRELSFRYSFDRAQLRPIFGGWVSRLTLGVIGRNLLTWTDYSGFDPEVGVATSNSGFGTYGYGPQNAGSTIVRFDGFTYPNFRTFTGLIEIEF
jgi:TonB-linked SusC/RagA family outer membrane protein